MIDKPIDIPTAIKARVEAKAAELQKEFGESHYGNELNARVLLRLILEELPEKGKPFLTRPAKGGTTPEASWGNILAIAKMCSNAAAINGTLKGYGGKKNAISSLAASYADQG